MSITLEEALGLKQPEKPEAEGEEEYSEADLKDVSYVENSCLNVELVEIRLRRLSVFVRKKGTLSPNEQSFGI